MNNINKQIAIKGAELLGIECHYSKDSDDSGVNIGHYINGCWFVDGRFDPVDNANDMNKLIEALKIDVTYHEGLRCWCAEYKEYDSLPVFKESRDEAIRECVIKALGLHNDSEALGVDND